MALDLKEREDQAAQLNPANESVGDRAFNDIVEKRFSKTAAADEDRNAPQKSNSLRDDIGQQEKSGAGSFYQQPPTNNSIKNKWSIKNLNGKQKGGIAGIGAVLILGGGGMFGLGGLGGMTIVNMSEVAKNKFGSNIDASLSNRSNKIWVKKMTPAAQKGLPTNRTCQYVKAMCKYDGLSDREIKKFKERGSIDFDLTGEKTVLGKNKVAAIRFNGQVMDAAAFQRELRTNPGLVSAVNKTFSTRFAIWANAPFKKLATKLGVSRGKNASAESDPEKVKEKIKKGQQGDVELDTTTRNVAAEGEELDEAKKKANAVADEIIGDGAKSATRSTLTAVARGVGKGVMVTGIIDTACTALNTLSAIGYASKIIGQEQLIRFAFQFMNLADAIKAGEATPEAMSVFGNMLTQKSVDDGRTAFDSYGYQYMAYDKLGNPDDVMEFKNGGGLSGQLLDLRNQISNYTAGVDQKLCDFIQNPFTRVASGVVGVFAAIFSAGTFSAANVIGSSAVSLLAAAAQSFAIPLLADMVAGELINDEVMADGNRTGNAFASGGGATFGANASAQSLPPVTKDQVVEFRSGTLKEYLAMNTQVQRLESSPFDAANPYTLTGSLLAKFTPYLTGSLTSSASNVALLGFKTLLNPLGAFSKSASAANSDLYICTDSDYVELNLATDPFCNVMYGLSPEMSATDPEAVTLSMIDMGAINPDTGAAASGGMGDRYSEFLSKCVNSTAPLGIFGNEDSDASMKPKDCVPNATDRYPEEFWVYTVDSFIIGSQDCIVGDDQAACSGDETPTQTPTTPTTPGNLPSGDAKSLAVALQSQTNINISRVQDQIDGVANGSRDDIATNLLATILGLSQANQRATISSMKRGVISAGAGSASWHPKGRAVDFSGSSGINGVPESSYGAFHQEWQDFLNTAASILPDGCQIGVPNSTYVERTKAVAKPNCMVFVDIGTAAHIHLGVS